MKIATFSSLEDATDKLNAYNSLARHITSPDDFALTEIYKHTAENIWWFNVNDCIDNGGMNKEAISDDVTNLTTVEIEVENLITEGYLSPEIEED